MLTLLFEVRSGATSYFSEPCRTGHGLLTAFAVLPLPFWHLCAPEGFLLAFRDSEDPAICHHIVVVGGLLGLGWDYDPARSSRREFESMFCSLLHLL